MLTTASIGVPGCTEVSGAQPLASAKTPAAIAYRSTRADCRGLVELATGLAKLCWVILALLLLLGLSARQEAGRRALGMCGSTPQHFARQVTDKILANRI